MADNLPNEQADKQANEVLDFWQKAGPAAWWKKDTAFDNQIIETFGSLFKRAVSRSIDDWRHDAATCLALVIVLDQFSRNMFRGDARTFAQDAYALELANHGVALGFDNNEPSEIYSFFHMPFMHSENLEDQETAILLITKKGGDGRLKSAIEHRDIIARFRRFPHRNKILGRQTSSREQAFLDGGGFAG